MEGGHVYYRRLREKKGALSYYSQIPLSDRWDEGTTNFIRFLLRTVERGKSHQLTFLFCRGRFKDIILSVYQRDVEERAMVNRTTVRPWHWMVSKEKGEGGGKEKKRAVSAIQEDRGEERETMTGGGEKGKKKKKKSGEVTRQAAAYKEKSFFQKGNWPEKREKKSPF